MPKRLLKALVGGRVCFRRMTSVKLAEVGKFETVHDESKVYPALQVFLHKVFGYRGIVLCHWNVMVTVNHYAEEPQGDPTDVFDTSKIKQASLAPNQTRVARNGKPAEQTYYQVLIDRRDWPYLRQDFPIHHQVSFIGPHPKSNMYALPGVDYVAHEEVLPYSPCQVPAIDHELYDKFVAQPEEDSPLMPRETLGAWIEENQSWMAMTSVTKATTHNVRVTAIPFYMGLKQEQNSTSYWWRYSIRIESLREDEVTLRKRHWRIFNLTNGVLETIQGAGVVGVQPLFTKERPAFQYSSHVSLDSPAGHMWGTFLMETKNGQQFEVAIPSFMLDSREQSVAATVIVDDEPSS